MYPRKAIHVADTGEPMQTGKGRLVPRRFNRTENCVNERERQVKSIHNIYDNITMVMTPPANAVGLLTNPSPSSSENSL